MTGISDSTAAFERSNALLAEADPDIQREIGTEKDADGRPVAPHDRGEW